MDRMCAVSRRTVVLLGVVVAATLATGCGPRGPERTATGVVVRLARGALKLEVFSPRTIRVVVDPTGRFALRPSLVVRDSPPAVAFEVTRSDQSLELRTAALLVRVDGKTGAVSFHDRRGRLLLREGATPRVLRPVVVLGEATHEVQQTFAFTPDEGIYGLGQYPDGIMNYRGHDITMTQANGTVVVPFFVSTHRYGVLWDNYSKTRFHDGADGCSLWSEVGDAVDYYFIAGADMDDVVLGYRQLTGTAPLFPKWAYGYFQSKERYNTGRELLDVVAEYPSAGPPARYHRAGLALLGGGGPVVRHAVRRSPVPRCRRPHPRAPRPVPRPPDDFDLAGAGAKDRDLRRAAGERPALRARALDQGPGLRRL